eukprot:6184782-Pleurochrysis_carterae.AAC.1
MVHYDDLQRSTALVAPAKVDGLRVRARKHKNEDGMADFEGLGNRRVDAEIKVGIETKYVAGGGSCPAVRWLFRVTLLAMKTTPEEGYGICGRCKERESERARERARKRASERESERARERESEKARERESERARERESERERGQASEGEGEGEKRGRGARAERRGPRGEGR